MSDNDSWASYEAFQRVQNILEKNKLLINEINANHETNRAESLQHNTVLIRELSANIGRIIELYRTLSAQTGEQAG